jgi:hypothetical protein
LSNPQEPTGTLGFQQLLPQPKIIIEGSAHDTSYLQQQQNGRFSERYTPPKIAFLLGK